MAAPENLTKETFLQKVFDYENETEWNYRGDLPAIIDFWAEWCQPCKMVAPILEELAQEYDGKLSVFKINTEEQQELAQAFGITSIPSLLFIPMDDKPQMAVGAYPKEQLYKIIKDVLKVES